MSKLIKNLILVFIIMIITLIPVCVSAVDMNITDNEATGNYYKYQQF